MKPGRVLVFVHPHEPGVPLTDGTVLLAEAPFDLEVDYSGRCLSDHEVGHPPQCGLLVFEGWIEPGSEPEPDGHWVGEWRPLTHWEMCRLRFGMTPFVDERGAGEKSG